MTVGLGPAQGEGLRHQPRPVLVTPDELPYEDGRLGSARGWMVNGERGRPRADAGEQHFAWPEILAHAARDTRLRPATCSARGRSPAAACSSSARCPPPDRPEGRWIEPGDMVALEADGLGRARDARSVVARAEESARRAAEIGGS